MPRSSPRVRLAPSVPSAASAAGLVLAALLTAACGADADLAPGDAAPDASAPVDLGPAPAPTPTADGGPPGDGAARPPDAAPPAPIPGFVTEIVRFAPGPCAGFGAARLPEVLYGPPEGAGDLEGGLDVLTLGVGGVLELGFAPRTIEDRPGPDFVVFENAFYAGGDPANPAADPAEVSVSDDGVTWHAFPCTATAYPYGACAGAKPVYASTASGIPATDVARAGGDAYDLADVGLARARYVRIVDRSTLTCPAGPGAPTNLGFDLDAVALVHAP